jgi:hypothetical protein
VRAASEVLIRCAARLLCTFHANHDIKTKLHRTAYGRVTLLCGVLKETLSKKSQNATKPAVNQHCFVEECAKEDGRPEDRTGLPP